MSDVDTLEKASEIAEIIDEPTNNELTEEEIIEQYNEAVAEGYFPTDEQLAAWKEQYPEANFRGLNFPGMYVIYKSLNLAEYKNFQNTKVAKEKELGRALTDSEVEQIILNMCVFWPLDFKEKLQSDKIFAAIPTITSQYIMVASGFVDVAPEIL